MEELFLPVLHSFENNNVFTGSYGALRFKVTPAITMKNPKEVDMEASSMLCELWHGPFCYEKSEMEAQETFPLSEEREGEYAAVPAFTRVKKCPGGIPGIFARGVVHQGRTW